MKIGTFSTVFGGGFLIVLWFAGVTEKDLLIIALVIFGNTSFQIFARGNVRWMEPPDYLKISEKMLVWVYSFISSVGLLAAVFIGTKIISTL